MKYNHFKLKLRAFVAVLVLFVFGISANAQHTTVSGVVKDAKTGEPILGASILEKGTNKGIISDLEGAFTISASSNATLVVKYIGYRTVEVPVAGKTNLTILINEDVVALGEVVAIGYATVKKNDATGSITAIKPDKLNKGLTTNAQDMIAGKIAGVVVTSGGGTPGGSSTIRIRGGSSLNSSNDPLIVVDGLAMDNNGIKGTANGLSAINPNDIESFTVLKDASATAIYGSRASNGVILITTKKGDKGSKLQISYDGNMSVSQIGKTIKVMNATDYKSYIQKLYGTSSDAYKALGTSDTNWQDQIYQTGIGHDHNISFTGGIKNLPYRASVGYTNQDGIIKTSNFERYTGSINLSPSLFEDHLKININLKGMSTNNRYADTGVVGDALSMDPTQAITSNSEPYKTSFGGYWQWATTTNGVTSNNSNAPKNPAATLNQKNDVAHSTDVIANAEFDYKVHFLPDLHAHLNLAGEFADGKQTTTVSEQAPQDFSNGGSINTDKETKTNKSISAFLQYNKEFGIHRIDVLGGWELQHFHRSQNYFKQPVVGTHIYQDSTTYVKSQNYLESFFGRINYTLNDKYLVTGTLRRDGSTRFSKANRWGLFPSVALGWKINEENFMKDIKEISDLKLRLGYGVTGQQDLGVGNDYIYLPVYTLSKTGASYPVGPNSSYVQTARPDGYNENIQWEETSTYNAGLDLGLLNGRFTANIDYYYRKTDKLQNQAPMAAGMNFSNKVIQNIGTLTNQGVEFSLNGKLITQKDFSWDLSYNVTFNQNKINKITTSTKAEDKRIYSGSIFQGPVQAHAEGYPSYSYFVYQQVYSADGKPIEGLYVDRNGDGKIDENDKYYDHSATPTITMGFATKFIYKNFDLGMNFHANLGNYMYNAVAAQHSDTKSLWQKGYLANVMTSAFETNFTGGADNYQSDYYVQKASFVRCDNITLGYSFKKLFNVISSGRLSATVQNPFVITSYKGLDPEVYGGIDQNIYPKPIVTVIGLSLNF